MKYTLRTVIEKGEKVDLLAETLSDGHKLYSLQLKGAFNPAVLVLMLATSRRHGYQLFEAMEEALKDSIAIVEGPGNKI